MSEETPVTPATTPAAAKPTAEKKAKVSKPVRVKFAKSWGVYNANETAAFDTEKADWLVQRKIAVKA